MNLDDRSPMIALSADGLTVQNNSEQWGGVRSTIGITKGSLLICASKRSRPVLL